MTVRQEANRIKERLRACTTVEEVEQVASEERELVMSWNPKGLSPDALTKALSKQPDEPGLMCLHVMHLKKFLISGFSK